MSNRIPVVYHVEADHRYAYFKKLTYFSTECIYSPDGQLLSSDQWNGSLMMQHTEVTLVSSSKTSRRSGRARSSISSIPARVSSSSRRFRRASSRSASPQLLFALLAYLLETCLRCGYMSSNDLCVCVWSFPTAAFTSLC